MGYGEPREGSWTDYVSYGKLTHASEDLIHKTTICSKLFNCFHKKRIRTGSDMLGIILLLILVIKKVTCRKYVIRQTVWLMEGFKKIKKRNLDPLTLPPQKKSINKLIKIKKALEQVCELIWSEQSRLSFGFCQ